ncbi:MAG: VOC family protein [Actinomycetota bacterium]|nr:VOC family protein [Actinomycetota bacterium]
MPVQRLNHAVLFVADVPRSVAFYAEALGFETVMAIPSGRATFLRAPGSTNDHDLGLFGAPVRAASSSERPTAGLYHLAWEVDTLAELARLKGVLSEMGALVGASDHGTTKSLYGRDPDGIEFEIAWVVPAAMLDDQAVAARAAVRPLDLEREQQRYGAETVGGVGVSIAA